MLTNRYAAAFEVERDLDDGEVIVREGDTGEEMFVVKRGAVVISRELHGERVVLAELGPGDFFGEMSVLESLPRDADAHARGPTTVLGIGPGALLVRLRRDPSFALELLHGLSGRLRAVNQQLADALGASPASGRQDG